MEGREVWSVGGRLFAWNSVERDRFDRGGNNRRRKKKKNKRIRAFLISRSPRSSVSVSVLDKDKKKKEWRFFRSRMMDDAPIPKCTFRCDKEL